MSSTHASVATFDDVYRFTPQKIVDCTSINDVRAAVRDAAAAGLRVRVMGSGYSWAPHVLTPGICIRLSRLNRIHRIDGTRKTILVDAGARLGDVSRALAAHHLCLPSLSFCPEVTIGGAVATGTHGTSPNWGTLSDFVRTIRIVLASGEVRDFGPDSAPEEMRAARAAVGMLGVIVQLELQAIAMPWVRFSELHMDLASFRLSCATMVAQYDHLWVHWTLGEDKIRAECLECRNAPTPGFHRYVEGGNGCWRPVPRLANRVYWHGLALAKNVLARSGLSSDGTPQPAAHPRKVWMSMQYGVAAAQMQTTIDLIRNSDFAREHAGRIVELKFLKGDTASHLGPNADGDAVLFNIWWLVDENIKFKTFDNFESVMRRIHARPHWGKLHRGPDRDYMQQAYPKWNAFETVRSRFDPLQVFSIFAA
jgi:L-gulono-1,4-lactone dehydrogenase